jgi:hypothetical protein
MLDACLLFDAPHGHLAGLLTSSWSYPGFDSRIVLASATYIYTQYTEAYSQIVNLHMSQMEITHSIIFTNQILHKVFIILTVKPSYQLTITQRITVI